MVKKNLFMDILSMKKCNGIHLSHEYHIRSHIFVDISQASALRREGSSVAYGFSAPRREAKCLDAGGSRMWGWLVLCAGLLCFRFPRTLQSFRFPRTLQLFLLGVVLGLS